MSDRREMQINIALGAYRAAYETANPGNERPRVTYDNGWVRFWEGGYCYQRKRLAQLDEMTKRLLDRVRADTS